VGHIPGVDVVVEAQDLKPVKGDDVDTVTKLRVLAELESRATDPSNKRIVFRLDTAPTEIVGTGTVEGVRVSSGDRIEPGLAQRSIGYLGQTIPGRPFDGAAGGIPNADGRVTDGERVVPGTYVTGWIKRGANGAIGTNRECARETVAKVWDDFDTGALNRHVGQTDLPELLTTRGTQPVSDEGWRSIDASERARGIEHRRPKVKFVEIADMLTAARR